MNASPRIASLFIHSACKAFNDRRKSLNRPSDDRFASCVNYVTTRLKVVAGRGNGELLARSIGVQLDRVVAKLPLGRRRIEDGSLVVRGEIKRGPEVHVQESTLVATADHSLGSDSRSLGYSWVFEN